MKLPDEDMVLLERYIAENIGEPDRLWRGDYPHHEGAETTIRILRADDTPYPSTATFCTLGLAHQSWEDRGFNDRFELISSCTPVKPEYGSVLATAAHGIVDSRSFIGPGSIFSDAVKVCDPLDVGARLPHLIAMFPYLWERRFESVALPSARVWFFQVQPISESERVYCIVTGWEEGLEVVFEAFRTKLHDLGRSSAI